MKLRKSAAVAAAIAALSLTATACGGKDGSAGDKPEGPAKSGGKELSYTVKKDVSVDSSVFKAAKKRGKLIIGAKADQPYLGFEDQSTKKRSGFDIEIAKMVAADLGFSPKQIEWKTVDSGARETAVSKGDVDLMIGTYTINPERKKQIDFAGPYFHAGASLLVRKDEKDIKGPDTVRGKKVCSIVGSTPLQNIKKPKYGAKVTELSKYSECVAQMLNNQVDAVTTDDAILMGYAAQNKGKLKVVGETFSDEPYGVGLKKGDAALQKAVADAIKAHQENGDYKKAFDATIGISGSKYQEPPTFTDPK
ncbi:glutamate ABC transporter substrate-binding protein [Streptomyces aurantiacus]|uniref:Putative ABC transporter glutamine-binding protein GlnH n=1 Tax=Streptomyces aurantiacus JA 4570 TaxID=1286094 RepID=S3ZJE3_9ACTN|nr:glutamate ABC transporter substrate-binding protein [Streptomyces aurantiacus]EPH42854.1 putative ABC transporter glutamine-binding protein GlnH [Streptomyces aurantiacus JA 4570]